MNPFHHQRTQAAVLACVALLALCAGCTDSTQTNWPREDAPTPSASTQATLSTEAPETPTFETAGSPAAPAIRDLTNPSLAHGPKPAEYQRYIMLHDTEVAGTPQSIIDSWLATGKGVAAHFVIGTDGSIAQAVPLDSIAHHAGFGDSGHNALFGTEDESRDDRLGTEPIGAWAPDYGMNSYSIGIELVHISGGAPYTEAQLEALDTLIAYLDATYGFESQIIDHKAWRTGNSDTSPEFAEYLANYQSYRQHTVS